MEVAQRGQADAYLLIIYLLPYLPTYVHAPLAAAGRHEAVLRGRFLANQSPYPGDGCGLCGRRVIKSLPGYCLCLEFLGAP